MTLSAGWGARTIRAMGGTSSIEQRLALALGAARSIIRVVDSHSPPMAVNWAQVGTDDKGLPMSISYTEFENARIALNPLPIVEKKLEIGDAIDIVAGCGLHEASHAEHSRERFSELLEIKPEPLRLSVWLLNIVEDVRIERDTAREWPGTKRYFEKLLGWMWGNSPVTPDFTSGELAERLKTVFLACRFPHYAKNGVTKEAHLGEIEWWQAWQADYLEDRAGVRETIERALERLNQNPDTAREIGKMVAAEKKEREAGEQLAEQLRRMIEDGGAIAGAPGVCFTRDNGHPALNDAMAEAVDKLVREQFRSEKPQFTDSNNQCDVLRVTKPEEDADSRAAYVGRPDALVEAMRTAIVFRQEKPEFDAKLQKTGDLDETELWRIGVGDMRVFSEHLIESRPDVAVGMLVDMSGSMVGHHLAIAQRLAQTFLWTLHDAEGVNLRGVWGHTGDWGASGADIYRLWEPGDPMSRLGLISSTVHGNNYDGFAIAWCVNQMIEATEPQRLLIVLSDGYPSARGYGGAPAQAHVRHVVDWAARQGVQVLQIAIDHSIRAADQEQMFGPGNWLPYVDDARLLPDLTRTLGRFTE